MRISSEELRRVAEFDEAIIRNQVGYATWARATALCEGNKVTDVEIGDDGVFSGRVASTGLRLKTWVGLNGGQPVLTCACIEGKNCQHSVALFLELRRQINELTTEDEPEWKTRLRSFTRAGDSSGEPIALLIDTLDPERPYWMHPLRPGNRIQWTKKRATWPDLVSTQWASVSDGLSRSHLGLIREGYRLAKVDDGRAARNEISLQMLGVDAAPWLLRLINQGIELYSSLDPLTPIHFDRSSWDLGCDLSLQGDELLLQMMAFDGDKRILKPRIDTATRLLILDGGTRVARVGGQELMTLFERGPICVPADQVAELATAYIPHLKRRFEVSSIDSSVDLGEEATVRIIGQCDLVEGKEFTLTWWAEYDYSGSPSRVRLQQVMDLEDVRSMLASLKTLARQHVPASLWDGEFKNLRLPAWTIPQFRKDVIDQLNDSRLAWEISDAVLTFMIDEVPLHSSICVTPSEGHNDWFDLDVRLDVGGYPVPFSDVLEAVAHSERYLYVDGHWVSIDKETIESITALLEEARTLSFDDEPRLVPTHLGLWEELDCLTDTTIDSQQWEARLEHLRHAGADIPLQNPVGATLRPYQVDGARWLIARACSQTGGILADDMGLGKTLQLLTALASLKDASVCEKNEESDVASSLKRDLPTLVVAPTSVLSTWEKEAQRFFPDLNVRTINTTGKRRERSLASEIEGADIVITSYTIVRIDDEEWKQIPFNGLILDEAQNVKNPRTAIHRVLRGIERNWTFAVSGTPVENSLGDLWSIMALAMPGLLPKWSLFNDKIRRPIENDHDVTALNHLHALLSPNMMRRTKEEVATDLPDKIESVITIDLGTEHRRIYDQHLMAERARILSLTDDPSAKIDILAALTRLRQLALDPGLVDATYGHVGSAKTEYLATQLEQIIPSGHQALIFSQFTTFLTRIRDYLERRGIATVQLDGSTTRRDEVIERFRSGEVPVFLISLKAGGTGLTLTEADYVYMMDPWWNPAAEAQAVDRAHRIGQTKKVNVYRLVGADTIENKVVALQERKRELVSTVVESSGNVEGGELLSGLDMSDLVDLLDN